MPYIIICFTLDPALNKDNEPREEMNLEQAVEHDSMALPEMGVPFEDEEPLEDYSMKCDKVHHWFLNSICIMKQ